MTHPSPHRYISAGRERDVSTDVLESAARQIRLNQTHGAEPVLSLAHLGHLTGAPYLYLRKIVQRSIDPYFDIVRPKRNGDMRALSSPEPVLMDVQRYLLRKSLDSVPLHDSAFAYRSGRSIRMCAERHVGAKWLLKFDLHSFFDRIGESRVFDVFRSQGYSALVSLELARLCTRSPVATRWGENGARYTAIDSYAVDVRGRLPQGGPTSGILANAIASGLDHDLFTIATRSGFTYTRYSDDLVFSSVGTFSRETARQLIKQVATAVSANNFKMHWKKLRVVPPGARHVVLGLLVDGGAVHLTPEFRRRVEVHVRGVKLFGLAEHAAHRNFDSILSLINHVNGYLAFAASVDALWESATREEWHAALSRNGFPF